MVGCGGQKAANIADPGTIEFQSSTEPPGPNCEYGGVKVQPMLVPSDAADAGAEAGTPDGNPFYVCNPSPTSPAAAQEELCPTDGTIEGDYTIENNADAERLNLAGCTTITGGLYVTGGSGVISLPQIRALGLLYVWPTDYPEGVLSGQPHINVPTITTLAIPALTGVQSLNIQANPTLSMVQIPPAAFSASITFVIMSNPSLPECQAEALAVDLPSGIGGGKLVSSNDASGTCP
jgi:hypothetical protein